MTIDWISFSPRSALAGGAIIGVAVSMFALVNGRVAGISGIVGGPARSQSVARSAIATANAGI